MLAIDEAVSSRKGALPVCLWRENPYGLVSLLHMILEYTSLFLSLSALFDQLEVLGKSPHLAQDLTEEERKRWSEGCLESLRVGLTACDVLDLGMSSLYLKEAIRDWEAYGLPHLVSKGRISELDKLLRNELDRVQFFHVPASKINYYDAQALFGAQVKDSFPSTSFDLKEAGNCYALSRNSACVFHLMGVLEIGLRVFADQFQIRSDHTNWHNIIEGIEKAIRNMDSGPNRAPDWKDRQEFFSRAATHFMFLKDAWRNYTAHARAKYDEQEAFDILSNVRGFMQKLATRLHE